MTPDLRIANRPAGNSARTASRSPAPGPLARAGMAVRQHIGALWYATAAADFLLRGPHPLKILARPRDPRRGDSESGGALAAAIAGGAVAIGADYWILVRAQAAEARWQAETFAFMADLAASANAHHAGTAAKALFESWIDAYPRWHPEVWGVDCLCERLINIFGHLTIVMQSEDLVYRSRVLLSVARQSRHLRRAALESRRGLPRLKAATALTLAGLLLPAHEKLADRGLLLLERSLQDCVLPDGGARSRRGSDTVEVLRLLLLLRRAFKARKEGTPALIQGALDRIGPFLRALQHSPLCFAALQGLKPLDAAEVSAWLREADSPAKPLTSLPHSGYHRLEAGDMVIITDSGPPPPADMDAIAHISATAFELSVAGQPVFVSMGSTGTEPLATTLRASAAHTMLVIDNANIVTRPGDGPAGHSLASDLDQITCHYDSDTQAQRLTLGHMGYARRYQVQVLRTLELDSAGNTLRGQDAVRPCKRQLWDGLPLALRFHLHPGVSARLQDKGRALLQLPSGENLSFLVNQPFLTLQSGLAMSEDDTPQASQSLVISIDKPGSGMAQINWLLTRG